jgi:hypothetical protein
MIDIRIIVLLYYTNKENVHSIIILFKLSSLNFFKSSFFVRRLSKQINGNKHIVIVREQQLIKILF